MAAPAVLSALTEAGVSIWLDDLSRDRITSGNLAELIKTRKVSGVTTNPTIFAGALSKGNAYQAQLAELAKSGADTDQAIIAATSDDVRAACDIFQQVFVDSNGFDGRVSIEVDPRFAHDTAATVKQAAELWQLIDRANLLIKIPATKAGLSAIEETIAKGISVNVTLIFSLERYREVIAAYLAGLEKAKQNGLDLAGIHSVASFFVSRVDTEIDARLVALGTDAATSLRSKAALANARLAYQLFVTEFASSRSKQLLAQGANLQRPLWASTGVKDPALPDTLYVTDLVAANVVNTMPEATLSAVADHAVVSPDTITAHYAESAEVLAALSELGISYQEVTEKLESEAVSKFQVSWAELIQTVSAQLDELR